MYQPGATRDRYTDDALDTILFKLRTISREISPSQLRGNGGAVEVMEDGRRAGRLRTVYMNCPLSALTWICRPGTSDSPARSTRLHPQTRPFPEIIFPLPSLTSTSLLTLQETLIHLFLSHYLHYPHTALCYNYTRSKLMKIEGLFGLTCRYSACRLLQKVYREPRLLKYI